MYFSIGINNVLIKRQPPEFRSNNVTFVIMLSFFYLMFVLFLLFFPFKLSLDCGRKWVMWVNLHQIISTLTPNTNTDRGEIAIHTFTYLLSHKISLSEYHPVDRVTTVHIQNATYAQRRYVVIVRENWISLSKGLHTRHKQTHTFGIHDAAWENVDKLWGRKLRRKRTLHLYM